MWFVGGEHDNSYNTSTTPPHGWQRHREVPAVANRMLVNTHLSGPEDQPTRGGGREPLHDRRQHTADLNSRLFSVPSLPIATPWVNVRYLV